VKRQQADPILVNLSTIVFRKRDELEELVDLSFEHGRVTT
jgi:hypothetical protein